jgi:hypothetical protein
MSSESGALYDHVPVVGQSSARGGGLSCDDGVVFTGPPAPKRRRRRISEQLGIQGPCVLVAILAVGGASMHKARWAQGFSARALLESLGPATLDWSIAARLTLLGVAVVRSWQFSRVGDSLGEHFDTMKSIVCRMRQRAQTLGCLSYPIFQVARLSQFVQIDCSPENRAMTELCQVSLSQGRFAVQGAQMSFAELLREFGLTGCIAQIPLLGSLADRIVQGAWSCLCVLLVHERVHRARLIIPSQPPRRQLLMWIREHRNRHDDKVSFGKCRGLKFSHRRA